MTHAFDDRLVDELVKEHQWDDEIAYCLALIAEEWKNLGKGEKK